MTNVFARAFLTAAFAAVVAAAAPAGAQEQPRPGGFLDNLFGGAQPRQPERSGPGEADLSVRINQLESQIRQLTGTIEQLQFRNQQLEQQLRAQVGTTQPHAGMPSQAAQPPGRPSMQAAAPLPPPVAAAPVLPPPPSGPGRRGDAFDPNQTPNAPGAPRPLGGGPGPVQSAAAPGSIAE